MQVDPDPATVEQLTPEGEIPWGERFLREWERLPEPLSALSLSEVRQLTASAQQATIKLLGSRFGLRWLFSQRQKVYRLDLLLSGTPSRCATQHASLAQLRTKLPSSIFLTTG